MTIFAVVATGQSLTQEDVDYLKDKCRVIVVSNAYEMAPWAEALVSHDRAWWDSYPDALGFAGDKFCRHQHNKVHLYAPEGMPQGCNSGLMAMFLARDRGASKIILLGFDMHGSHYFGPHLGGRLKNTTSPRFRQHISQFKFFDGGPTVVNCTPGSALDKYPKIPLKDVI